MGDNAPYDDLRTALRELVEAGEPYVGDAFPREQLSGDWLLIWNRWMAAMNDARRALDAR